LCTCLDSSLRLLTCDRPVTVPRKSTRKKLRHYRESLQLVSFGRGLRGSCTMLAANELGDGRERMNARPMNSATRVRFLMCPPKHFAVSYSINPWMDPKAWASGGRALCQAAERQWDALQNTLRTQGAAIEFVDPKPDLPDLVFTANAAVVLDGKALLARFRHPERQCEEPIFGAAFQALQARDQIDTMVQMPDDMWLEGAGDCIWDRSRRHFWMGFGPRSHRGAAQVVSDAFGVECAALELADPSFYHLDTAFCPLPSGDVIYYPGAFTPAARGAIEERVAPTQRIALDRADAVEFAANAVSFDYRIVLSSCSDTLKQRLEERGFTVLATPLHSFLRSGGSACCLTLRLDHRSDRMSPGR
jgi:N-dimethylarginine dimethylaminohydrolase